MAYDLCVKASSKSFEFRNLIRVVFSNWPKLIGAVFFAQIAYLRHAQFAERAAGMATLVDVLNPLPPADDRCGVLRHLFPCHDLGPSAADADGDSDGLDFLEWQKQFGSGVSAIIAASHVVPEPTT